MPSFCDRWGLMCFVDWLIVTGKANRSQLQKLGSRRVQRDYAMANFGAYEVRVRTNVVPKQLQVCATFQQCLAGRLTCHSRKNTSELSQVPHLAALLPWSSSLKIQKLTCLYRHLAQDDLSNQNLLRAAVGDSSWPSTTL